MCIYIVDNKQSSNQWMIYFSKCLNTNATITVLMLLNRNPHYLTNYAWTSLNLLNIQCPQPHKEISASPHQYIISTDVISDHRIQASAQFIWNYGLDTILMYNMQTTYNIWRLLEHQIDTYSHFHTVIQNIIMVGFYLRVCIIYATHFLSVYCLKGLQRINEYV